MLEGHEGMLPNVIRPPAVEELAAVSALCFRSKAVWGYDRAFMEACRKEFSIQPADLQTTSIAVAEREGQIVGVAQIRVSGGEADLLKLFVEPTALRRGIGKTLFAWATRAATQQGADRLVIEADPGAVAFYRQMGAEDAGLAPSGSIPGRMLPRLVTILSTS